MSTQVTDLAQARSLRNPQRYPHVVHRFLGCLHKSSTSLRTEQPGLLRLTDGESLASQQDAASKGPGTGPGGAW